MAKNYAELMIKGSLTVFLLAAVGTVLGYVLRVFLSRNLTVAEFGLFYAIMAFVGLLNLFKDSGLSTTLAKFIPEFITKRKPKELKFSFIFTLGVQLLIGFIVLVFMLLFADQIALGYFHTQEAVLPFKIVLLSFFTSIFMIMFQSTFRGFGDMKYYSLIDPMRIIITFVSVIFLIYLGVLGVAYAYLIASILVSVVAFFVIHTKFQVLSTKFVSFKPFRKLGKKLLLFSFPIFIGSIGGIVLFYIDTIALTMFRTLEEVGLYQVAMPTSQLLWVFIASATPIILPLFSEIWARKEKQLLSSALTLLIKLSFIFMLPIVLVLVSFPDLIIVVLFGGNYLAAAPALQILSISAILYTLTALLGTVLIAIGKPYLQTKTIFIMAVASLILNFSLVPFFGIIGASLAFISASFVGLLFSIYFLKKTVSIFVPWVNIIKAFVGGFFTLAIIIIIKGLLVLHPYPEAAICLVAGFLFYVFFIVQTRTVTKNDLIFLQKTKLRIPDIFIRIIFRVVKT